MNKQILFKSALSLVAAVAAGSAFAAATPVLDEDFESFSDGYAITNAQYWSADGADESKVAGDSSNLYLDLKTEGSTLTRTLDQASTLNTALSGGTLTVDNPAVFSAEVKFVPSDTADCGLAGGTDDTKFAIFACAQDNGPTNLVVFHRNGSESYTNEEFTVSSVNFDDWTKVSVKMFDTTDGLFFEVALNDGAPLTPAPTSYTDPKGDSGYPATWFKTVNDEDLDEGNKQFSAICFKGTGAVDDLKVDLGEAEPTTFTVTLNAGSWTPASLTTNGVAVSPVPDSIVVDPNTEVVFGVSNTDGAVKTYTVTPTADYILDASGATFGWPEYLGAAVDGAYEIDNLAELKLFQKGIATTTNELKLATAGETFKLTADIALDAAWPGIGVQNGKDICSKADFNAAAFQGTFDGQNHTISGFQMVGVAGNPANNGEGLDYCGFFNSTCGATIQNLKIAYAGGLFAVDTTSSTKESGATFVGVAKNSTLCNLTTVAGTVSCSKGFGGIVGFLMAGSTVDSCTNNVNLTSMSSNKAGGIAMVTQLGSGTATIRNCVNNGTTTGNVKQKGGIIGYVGTEEAVAIENCTDNAGSEPTFFSFDKATGGITVSGVNTAPASVVPCKTTGGAVKAVSGLTFATVDNGVATFVADNALAAGNTYNVFAPGTATYAFATAGTIAFDTALATPTYAITAPGLVLSYETVGNVKTYTARAYATPTVTVNGGANATAAWEVNGAPVAEAPASLTEGQTYSVTYTANEGYEFAAGAVTSASGTAGTEAITITIDDASKIQVSVTVTGGANATAAWTVNGNTVSAPANLEYGDTYSVTYTANTGYHFAAGAVTSNSGTAGTENITITIANAVQDATTYGTTEGTDTAVAVSGNPDHTLTQPEATFLNAIVAANGNDAAANTAVESKLATMTEKDFQDAALLNQNILADGYTPGYEFNVKGIKRIKEEGVEKVQVTIKLDRPYAIANSTINGTLSLKVSTDGKTWIDGASVNLSELTYEEGSEIATATLPKSGNGNIFKAIIQ